MKPEEQACNHPFSPRSAIVALAILLVASLHPATIPEARSDEVDRSPFLKPETRVSDDPRRVPVPDEPSGPGKSIVLTGGRIFDGTGAPARAASLVIEGNHIVGIFSPEETRVPANAQVLDLHGKFVLPGLIDLHTHLSYPESNSSATIALDTADQTLRGMERLRFFIESGITSVRDVASAGSVPFRLKEWVREHRLPGPRIFAAGQLITATGGHGAQDLDSHAPLLGAIREASGPDDWREAVREQYKAGADLIKVASHFTREEIAAAIDEAHALGIRVTADAETFYIRRAVEAGIDCIEHPLPRSQETIELMAKNGVASVPTLTTYIYIFDEEGGYFGSTSRRFTFSKEANLEMLRRLKDAGVKIGVGTDLVGSSYRFLPKAYITELEQLIAVGYSASEALVAATKTSAEILGMADKLGTLEPGKLADVVVIDGRPDKDVSDLEKVEIVIRDGEVVVLDGKVSIPRHIPVPPPEPRQ